MQFLIRCTSGKEPPCEGSYQNETREDPREEAIWRIDINSLEELLQLQKLVGKDLIIIGSERIEIYDEYRE